MPIYTEYRSGGNNCFTLIKRISGDAASLSSDLAEYFTEINTKTASDSQNATGNSVDENEKKKQLLKKWRIREELGHVWIHGNHTQIVRKFLESKGF